MNVTLTSLPLPNLAEPGDCPQIRATDYDQQLDALYAAAQCDWVVVYADREHNANLVFLTNFDPRFEEAILLLGPASRRVLLLGNEGMGYTSQAVPRLEFVLCQSLSLMGQPRDVAPRLDAVLRATGIAAGNRVGVIGWKYLEPEEDDAGDAPAFVPSILVRVIRRLVGGGGVVKDTTALMMHPSTGLKSHNTSDQIAQFAWAAALASNSVLRAQRLARPGMTERAGALTMAHEGMPYSCHPMFNSASPAEPVVGLRSPGTRVLAAGDGVSAAVGYWGSLCARAGLLSDAPNPAFMERVVVPYFRAIATWYQTLHVGVTGDEMHRAVMGALVGAAWRPALNPGHLVSIDEWTHSPIRPSNSEKIASGMALQCDIIPAPMPNGWALNCEDTVAIADANMRAELQANHPRLWSRIVAQRAFMREALGLRLSEDVLPLSTANAFLAPFWLAPGLVCAVSP